MEFIGYDATFGEDDDHLVAVYRMGDGTEERIPKKQQTAFEAQHKNDRKLTARIAELEARVSGLEAQIASLLSGSPGRG